MSRDKKIAQLMARRHPGSRLVEVHLVTLNGKTVLVEVSGGDTKRRPIERRTRS